MTSAGTESMATPAAPRWVAKETASELGYRYPDIADERVTAWISSPFE